MKNYLPYSTPKELFEKAERLRKFHVEQSDSLRSILDAHGVEYAVLDTYGGLSITNVPDGVDVEKLIKPFSKGIARMLNELGVITVKEDEIS